MNLRDKIFYVFFVSAVFIISTAVGIFYHISANGFKKQISAHLQTAVKAKTDHLNIFLETIQNRMIDFSSDGYIKSHLYAMRNRSRTGIRSEGLVKYLKRNKLPVFKELSEVFVMNPSGEIVASTVKENIGLNRRNNPYFVYGKKGAFIQDLVLSETTGQAELICVAPVKREKELLGVIAGRIKPEKFYEILLDRSGLGTTGEVYLVNRERYVISPLRFRENVILKEKNNTLNVRECFRDYEKYSENSGNIKAHEEKVLIFKNYREVEVIGHHAYIPKMKWALLAEIEKKEAFSPLSRLLRIFIIDGLSLVILIYLASNWISYRISKPITRLKRGVEAFERGNLGYRVEVEGKDEIGRLALVFNNMASKIEESYKGLEEKVKQKTAELSQNLEKTQKQKKALEEMKSGMLNVMDDLEKARGELEEEKARLQEQKRDLEKANTELDSFVYTASHDLRAPLRAIASFAKFIEEDYKDKLDAQGKDYIDEINKGANRMSELIEDLLALSRISRIKNPYEDVNMRDIIESVIKQVEFDIRESKTALKIHPGFPVVKCDRIKIAEVFLNLITNAIKFSSKNSKKDPRVEVGYVDKGEAHEFFVKDNGIGIDPQYHGQVFGIFKRLHTNSEYEGTGAGLSIVKRIIDDHNGSIRIESEVGKGAAFYFTIPKGLVKKKKLGEILIADGLITEEDLKKGLGKQKEKGPPEDKGEI